MVHGRSHGLGGLGLCDIDSIGVGAEVLGNIGLGEHLTHGVREALAHLFRGGSLGGDIGAGPSLGGALGAILGATLARSLGGILGGTLGGSLGGILGAILARSLGGILGSVLAPRAILARSLGGILGGILGGLGGGCALEVLIGALGILHIPHGSRDALSPAILRGSTAPSRSRGRGLAQESVESEHKSLGLYGIGLGRIGKTLEASHEGGNLVSRGLPVGLGPERAHGAPSIHGEPRPPRNEGPCGGDIPRENEPHSNGREIAANGSHAADERGLLPLVLHEVQCLEHSGSREPLGLGETLPQRRAGTWRKERMAQFMERGSHVGGNVLGIPDILGEHIAVQVDRPKVGPRGSRAIVTEVEVLHLTIQDAERET